ncbi:hypothetical protein BAE44_0015020 [Dichanthelium oligosanthes]|uniref:KIB1-4 beta-propeller domain-containing protein n=1 Tax=Dichanthelium oligosanthes TaxID=888268 RepID=A0A1E5VFT2_9POAL|nr:hypothetical protein BAE44_0015020 [Dichanthelium oligosanthes]
MMAATQSSSWPDLQPEILGLVLGRLPSLADRVRLRAVCRPWRCNAQWKPLPPPLPWLSLLDETFLSLPDGEIHRMPVPDDASCHGSVDSWLILVHNDGRCSLMNPFSKATSQLPKLSAIWNSEMRNAYHGHPLFYKLVVPLSLDLSSDSLVAALIMDASFHSTISICQPSVATDTIRNEPGERLIDVAFFGGKLYAGALVKLFVVDIGVGHNGKPKISSVKCIVDSIDDSGSTSQSFTGRSFDNYYFCSVVYSNILLQLPVIWEHNRMSLLNLLASLIKVICFHKSKLVQDSTFSLVALSSEQGQLIFVRTKIYAHCAGAGSCQPGFDLGSRLADGQVKLFRNDYGCRCDKDKLFHMVKRLTSGCIFLSCAFS